MGLFCDNLPKYSNDKAFIMRVVEIVMMYALVFFASKKYCMSFNSNATKKYIVKYISKNA